MLLSDQRDTYYEINTKNSYVFLKDTENRGYKIEVCGSHVTVSYGRQERANYSLSIIIPSYLIDSSFFIFLYVHLRFNC